MNEPDAKALERALEVSNRGRQRETEAERTMRKMTTTLSDKLVVSFYEARLRRIMFFIEGVTISS